MYIGGVSAARRSLELITFTISSICGIVEDVGNAHAHTMSTGGGVTNTDRDECVLGNLSEAVRDVASSDE